MNLVAMDFVLQVTVVELVLGALDAGRTLSFELSRGTKASSLAGAAIFVGRIFIFAQRASNAKCTPHMFVFRRGHTSFSTCRFFCGASQPRKAAHTKQQLTGWAVSRKMAGVSIYMGNDNTRSNLSGIDCCVVRRREGSRRRTPQRRSNHAGMRGKNTQQARNPVPCGWPLLLRLLARFLHSCVSQKRQRLEKAYQEVISLRTYMVYGTDSRCDFFIYM